MFWLIAQLIARNGGRGIQTMALSEKWAGLGAFVVTLGVFAAAPAQTIYFTEVGYPDSAIQRIESDGSDHRVLAITTEGIRGIALDGPHRMMYWSDVELDEIYRAPIGDLGEAEAIVSGLTFPIDLAVDSSRGILAWVDTSAGVIELSDLEGRNRRELHGGGELSCVCIAIDLGAGALYFEDRATASRGAVRRINLDGSRLETIVDDVPTATDIALDPEREYVYWGSSAGFDATGGVYRVRYDGTGFEEIFVSDFFNYNATSLTLDLANRFIYFSLEEPYAKEGLYRMGLDGQYPIRITGQFDSIVHMDLLQPKSPALTRPHP